MLETETKRFEDLEFQQLERESRQDEEKETHTQQLLREVADNQRSTVTRKVAAVLWGCVQSHGLIYERWLVHTETNPVWPFPSVESV